MAFFSATPAKTLNLPTLDPEQLSALRTTLSAGLANLQQPYQGFEPIAQQARTRFQQQTVPSLVERFTGTGGALSSPSFASQLGRAGAGLETGLAALQSQYGLQNRAQGLNMLNLGLRPTFQPLFQPEQPSGLEALVGSILPTIGLATPFLARNYFGRTTPQSETTPKSLNGILALIDALGGF
jgi:hypothetical protein